MNTDLSSFGKLRDIAQNELEMMLSWRNSPGVRANMYTRHEITFSEHVAWWERTQIRADQRYFMYQYQEKPLGIVYLNNIDTLNKNTAWGFYASPDAPKGTGSRMEYLALEYIFNEMKLHRLHCEVLAFNVPVIKLHKKFGFQVEGVQREQKLLDGAYVDVYCLGILASEWKSIRQEVFDRLIKISKS